MASANPAAPIRNRKITVLARRTTIGPNPGADQATDTNRNHGGPVDRCQEDERHRSNRVGDPEQDILGGVRAGQTRPGGVQKQGQQQDTGCCAEIAAVDGDEEDPHCLADQLSTARHGIGSLGDRAPGGGS